MNRADLQRLSEERLADAALLAHNGRFGGAYYLAGYAVECSLKACIAKLTKQEDFYDKDRAKKIFTHNLESLADVARLSAVFKRLSDTNSRFRAYWGVVKGWSEESRYETHTEAEARELLAAVADPDHGVLACTKRYW